MAYYKGHIPEVGIQSLRALFAMHDIREIYAPEIEVHLDGLSPQVMQLAFWIDGGADDFVCISTDWNTTESGFDYHIYTIERGKRPGMIPYRPAKGEQPRAIGPTSTLHVEIGKLERIEVIAAHCNTGVSDKEPEIVDYDRCLRLIGSSDSILLSTDFNSILGAIEVRRDGAPEIEDMIESYRVRYSLGRYARAGN